MTVNPVKGFNNLSGEFDHHDSTNGKLTVSLHSSARVSLRVRVSGYIRPYASFNGAIWSANFRVEQRSLDILGSNTWTVFLSKGSLDSYAAYQPKYIRVRFAYDGVWTPWSNAILHQYGYGA